MLGYFGLYGGKFSDRLRIEAEDGKRRRSSWLGRLPHEIAALNAR